MSWEITEHLRVTLITRKRDIASVFGTLDLSFHLCGSEHECLPSWSLRLAGNSSGELHVKSERVASAGHEVSVPRGAPEYGGLMV
jgi:hypothetical protein